MKKIFISAGHSNSDPGAVHGNIHEAEIAVAIRNAVVAKLALRGVTAQSDGVGQANKTLAEALQISKALPADALRVEIHLNAGPSSARGIEALAKVKYKTLSQDLCAAVRSITGSPLRGDKGYKADDSGQHTKLGFCEAGGVILEVGFISNDAERSLMMHNCVAIGEAIAGVLFIHAQ